MVLGLALALATLPQTQTAPDPAHDLDFWVGEWNCTGRSRTALGKDEWKDTTATNSIKRTLGDAVIEENFKMGEYLGRSVSVYDKRNKMWRQTWVDSSGGYLVFQGGKAEEGFVLRLVTLPTAPKGVGMRMVFHDVKKDSFVWDWERTTDDGKTWELQWRLNYKRKG